MKSEYAPPKLTVFGNVEELTQTGDFDPSNGSVFQVATRYGRKYNPYRKYKRRSGGLRRLDD